MLSTPARENGTLWGGRGASREVLEEERFSTRSLVRDLVAVASMLLPPNAKVYSCVPRLTVSTGALEAPVAGSQRTSKCATIRTTADMARRTRHCFPEASVRTSLAPPILTTAPRRGLCESEDPPSEDLVAVQSSAPLFEKLVIVRQAAEMVFPSLLMAPLMMHSPWSALGGVVMCASPPVPPAMTPQQVQRMVMSMKPASAHEEDEQFMGLVFPGFDANSFMWQVTCWQAAEFALSMFMGHNKANPLPCVLYRLGASWGPALARGQVWRLITPVMLHANLTHLLFNVFFQLRMGFGMEKQFGRTRMMLLYFACGIVGNIVSVCLDPFKLAVGASTAGFGLIGVWFAEILLSWNLLGPARERTVIWIAFMLISVTTMSSMTPNMDLWGHFGGALGGFLLSIIVSDMAEEERPEWYAHARVMAVIALSILLTGGIGKILKFTPLDPIPNCPILPSLGSLASMATATS